SVSACEGSRPIYAPDDSWPFCDRARPERMEDSAVTVAHSVRSLVCLSLLAVPVFSLTLEHLTSRPRPAVPEGKAIRVGEEVRTASSQRRRVSLPDGSVLFVNQQTVL